MSDLLAPLQRLMLQNSIESNELAQHFEQLEIVFLEAHSAAKLSVAWSKIVAQTQVLRMAFFVDQEGSWDWQEAAVVPVLSVEVGPMVDWQKWLEQDRLQPLLITGQVPWRVRYWPESRRWVWSFHHALLDGRSIRRIAQEFLKTLTAKNDPVQLGLSHFPVASDAEIAVAAEFYRKALVGLDRFRKPQQWQGACSSSADVLGGKLLERLETLAADLAVSASNVVTWAWAQAVIEISGKDFAVVEQIRCGAPQNGCAGFTMNLLPLVIQRAYRASWIEQLRHFGVQSLALRGFESIHYADLPTAIVELAEQPWSSVIMTENHSLRDFLSHEVEFVKLHEATAHSLTAFAFLRPNLRLEVEGPDAESLLKCWKRWLQVISAGAAEAQMHD